RHQAVGWLATSGVNAEGVIRARPEARLSRVPHLRRAARVQLLEFLRAWHRADGGHAEDGRDTGRHSARAIIPRQSRPLGRRARSVPAPAVERIEIHVAAAEDRDDFGPSWGFH